MEFYFDVITEEELQYLHESAIKIGKLDFERELVRGSSVSNRLRLAKLYAYRKDRENFLRIMAATENDKERLNIRWSIWGCQPSPEGWEI